MKNQGIFSCGVFLIRIMILLFYPRESSKQVSSRLKKNLRDDYPNISAKKLGRDIKSGFGFDIVDYVGSLEANRKEREKLSE